MYIFQCSQSLRAYAGCEQDPVSGYLVPYTVRQMEEAVFLQGSQRYRNKTLVSSQTPTGRLLTSLKPSDFLLT